MENGVVKSNGSPMFERRVEFHSSTKRNFSELSNSDFQLVTVNSGSGSGGGKMKKLEGSEFGLDPEINFGFTLRTIGAGLENLGNTCFLNSVLQCLTHTEPLAAYLQSGKHQSSCHIAGFCALCAIQKHVSRALRSTGSILAPKDLVSNLRRISRTFRNARQEDAHEYMVNLLESMHRCCLPSGILSESPNAYEKSLVHKIFGGRLRSQVKCLACFHCSNKFDPFLDLSLEIANADSLYKALKNFTAAELLDGGERQYNCQQCKQKVRASKQLTVDKAPYVLTIHLKRFRAYDPGHKIDKKVHFDPTMDLKPFVSGSYEGDLNYTLYGVLVHYGWSTHSGHYYCFVRTSSGMWYSLDDNQVVQVSEVAVLQQKAYMLFYVRDRKSFSMKKPINVSHKENVQMDVRGNKPCQNMNNVQKGSIQNSANQRMSKTVCSAPSVENNALGFGLTKNDYVPEASSIRSSNSVSSDSSLPEKGTVLRSTSKEPVLQSSPKEQVVQSSPKEPVLQSSPKEPILHSSPKEPTLHSSPKKPVFESPPKKPVLQSPPKEPVLQSPPKEPVLQSPPKKPVLQSPPMEPVLQSPPKEPVLQSPPKESALQSPPKEPLLQSPPKEPVLESPPPKEPVLQSPSKGPVLQSPSKEPVPQSSSNEPLQQFSSKDHVLQSSLKEVHPLKVVSEEKPVASLDLFITGNCCVEQNSETVINGSRGYSLDSGENLGSQKNLDVALMNSFNCCNLQESPTFKVLAGGKSQKIESISNVEVLHKESSQYWGPGKFEKVDLVRPPSKPSPNSIQDNSTFSNRNAHALCGKTSNDERKPKPASPELPSSSNISSESIIVKASHNTRHRLFRRRYMNRWTAGMRMSARILLRANLGICKKKTHKRTRSNSSSSWKPIQESLQESEAISVDLGPSTSEKATKKYLNTTHGGRKTVKPQSKIKVDKIAKKEARKSNKSLVANLDRKLSRRVDQNGAVLATDIASQCDANVHNSAEDCRRDMIQNGFLNMLTRGLEETIVARWDGIDIPAARVVESTNLEGISVGYMPDKWDEEYDRGKRKKQRHVKHGFTCYGPNPFQQIANKKSKLKRSRMDLSSGKVPFRIK